MNGLVGIHTGFDAFYHALQNAQSSMTTKIGAFSGTFAPIWSTDKSLKLALDLVGLGFAMVAAPTWNKCTYSFKFANDKSHHGDISLLPIGFTNVSFNRVEECSGI
jgi:hypothetical protein